MVAMPKVPPIPYRMTTEEFLHWIPDDADTTRWQLVDGEPVAMAPANIRHGRLQARIATLLTLRLDQTGSPCSVVTAPGVVPGVRPSQNVRIPDLGVTCAPDQGDALLPEPVLLIEILSPSNERETWTNIWAYATIPSVREIVVFSAVVIRAQVLRRASEGHWLPEPEVVEAGAELRLDSIGGAWPVGDFYATTALGRR
jgi:Uma2 family endonuclease